MAERIDLVDANGTITAYDVERNDAVFFEDIAEVSNANVN